MPQSGLRLFTALSRLVIIRRVSRLELLLIHRQISIADVGEGVHIAWQRDVGGLRWRNREHCTGSRNLDSKAFACELVVESKAMVRLKLWCGRPIIPRAPPSGSLPPCFTSQVSHTLPFRGLSATGCPSVQHTLHPPLRGKQ